MVGEKWGWDRKYVGMASWERSMHKAMRPHHRVARTHPGLLGLSPGYVAVLLTPCLKIKKEVKAKQSVTTEQAVALPRMQHCPL